MAGSNRRFTVAAIVLPLLFLVMSGLARASSIFVNTTDGESDPAPLCTLPDAVAAHNAQIAINGCTAGNGNDNIFFDVTGTIFIDEPLEITNGSLFIAGPIFGCSGAGPCGITIDGEGTVQIIKADPTTTVGLLNLTFAHGFATTSSILANTGGGAIFANGTDLEVHDCLFVNNTAQGEAIIISPASAPVVPVVGGLGGAIYGNTGSVVIVNSTFANNTAVSGISATSPDGILGESEGGAIYDAGATISITNCTIANNTAQSGGGFAQDYLSPIAPIKGTILQSNTGGNCGGVIAGDVGYNISSDATCPFVQPTSLNMTDSLLEPLANNGGPTETFALETSPAVSPAIDRIPVAQCTDQQSPTPQPLGTDQRLFARPDPANLNACDSGAFEVGSVAPIVLVPGTERVQIARSTSPNSDQVNIGLSFIYNGDPDCDLEEDALNSGFGISLIEGTCASLPNSGLALTLNPFVVHTVNHQSYGTLFQTSVSETVSARLVTLPAPMGTCGEWALNLEVSGLDTPALGLGGGNPFALLISDLNDATQCFDVTNAIVGNQIVTSGHSVTRKVRRRTRRR